MVAAGIGRVGATETGVQLRHLRDNVTEGSGNARIIIQTADIAWGIKTEEFNEKCKVFGGEINFFMSSDILYIALRDGLGDELRATLIDAASRLLVNGGGGEGAIFFGFEERLHREEAEWLETLKTAGLTFEEISTVITQSDMLENAGGPPTHNDDEDDDGGGDGGGRSLESIFWQPPDIRMFLIRATKI